jgi:hypothetical protein
MERYISDPEYARCIQMGMGMGMAGGLLHDWNEFLFSSFLECD